MALSTIRQCHLIRLPIAIKCHSCKNCASPYRLRPVAYFDNFCLICLFSAHVFRVVAGAVFSDFFKKTSVCEPAAHLFYLFTLSFLPYICPNFPCLKFKNTIYPPISEGTLMLVGVPVTIENNQKTIVKIKP